jgi:putative spermidine/putrescine transport system permease protein
MKSARAYYEYGLLEHVIIRGSSALIILMTLSPILVVLLMSFTSENSLQFPPPSLSLRWYDQTLTMMFGSDADIMRLRESLLTSVGIALATAFMCTICGIPAAYAMSRIEFRGRAVVEVMVSLPIIFPTIVLGISLLIILSNLPYNFGIWQIAVAHAIVLLPLMVRNCYASLRGLDGSLIEAARTLGASISRTFLEIVLPLMRPGIMSGFLLIFIMSLNEFTLAYFLYSIEVFPLSLWLFQRSDTSLDPAIFAVSSIVILINVVAVLLLDRLMGKRGMSL